MSGTPVARSGARPLDRYEAIVFGNKPAGIPQTVVDAALDKNPLLPESGYIGFIGGIAASCPQYGTMCLQWMNAVKGELETSGTPLSSPLTKKSKLNADVHWERHFNTPHDPSKGINLPALKSALDAAAGWAKTNMRAHSGLCSLIQSSGTGKSRAIKELSMSEPLLYMCVAPLTAKCYPRRSALWSRLKGKIGSNPENFLGYWLQASLAFLERMNCTVPQEWWAYQAESIAFEDMVLPKFQETYSDEELAALIKRYRDHWSLSERHTVVLVIDEARTLITGGTAEWLLYRRFRRGIQSVRQSMVVGLCLDTSARLSNFSPALTKDPSLRINSFNSERYDLYPPNFALHLPKSRGGNCAFADTFTQQYIAGIGRPLWNVFPENCMSELVDFAAKKLNNGIALDGSTVTELASVAILGFSAGLRFHPTAAIAETLVASHMAILAHVSLKRDFLYISWPIEPVLALAATTALTVYTEDILKYFIPFTAKWISDTGSVGELCSRIVLLIARGVHTHFDRMTVRTFLERLTSERLWNEMVSLLSDMEQLEDKVNFTQFAKTDREVSSVDMACALKLLCALSGKTNQAGYGCVVPTFSGVPDAEISEDNTRGIWVEVKNGQSDSARSVTNHAVDRLVRKLRKEEVSKSILIIFHLNLAEDDEYFTERYGYHIIVANPLHASSLRPQAAEFLAKLATAKFTPDFEEISKAYQMPAGVEKAVKEHFSAFETPFAKMRDLIKEDSPTSQ